ncbi:MAG: amidohydrolase family protein [Clostridia bacterium]|nr:amidohydrolase family protein [Clostridia bacterium]
MIGEFSIIDGHVHTFSTDEISSKIITSFNKVYNIGFKNPGTGTINDVLENMKRIGIDYTVMTNFAPPKILHDNNMWAIGVSKEFNNLIPLVSFHPDMGGSKGTLLELYIKEGARGIKIHPMAQGFRPDNRKMDEVYKVSNEVAYPIVFHCGRVANARLNEYADLDMILPIVDKYPGIPFVLTHMADGCVEDVIKIAENFPNVYFDTSIVITGYPPIKNTNKPSWLDDSMVLDVVKAIGAQRLVFGSDYPWGSPGHDIERFLKMQLDSEQKRLILGENAKKIYKL